MHGYKDVHIIPGREEVIGAPISLTPFHIKQTVNMYVFRGSSIPTHDSYNTNQQFTCSVVATVITAAIVIAVVIVASVVIVVASDTIQRHSRSFAVGQGVKAMPHRWRRRSWRRRRRLRP